MENKQTMTETTFKGFKWFAEQGGDPVLALENELLNNQSMTETQTILKASDLRIGNWILGGRGDGVIKQQVTIEMMEYLLNENFAPHAAIQPIPLTPEILEKCGYKQFDDDRDDILELETENHLCYLRKEKDGSLTPVEPADYPEYVAIGIELKYLHQLQNLYHSLTGTELEFKL